LRSSLRSAVCNTPRASRLHTRHSGFASHVYGLAFHGCYRCLFTVHSRLIPRLLHRARLHSSLPVALCVLWFTRSGLVCGCRFTYCGLRFTGWFTYLPCVYGGCYSRYRAGFTCFHLPGWFAAVITHGLFCLRAVTLVARFARLSFCRFPLGRLLRAHLFERRWFLSRLSYTHAAHARSYSFTYHHTSRVTCRLPFVAVYLASHDNAFSLVWFYFYTPLYSSSGCSLVQQEHRTHLRSLRFARLVLRTPASFAVCGPHTLHRGTAPLAPPTRYYV